MKYAFLLSLSVFISSGLAAQIGGLSASKFGAQCVEVIGHKNVEFEPGFFHARSSQYWDRNGDLHNYYSTADSIKVVTGFYFRFTYGLWDKLEFGLSLSNDLEMSQWGVRYAFLQKEKYGLALISGVNIPFGNRTIDQRVRATNDLMQAGLGLVGSYAFTKNLSLDFTGQYLHFLQKTDDNEQAAVYLNADLGYYILNHQFQFVVGTAFHATSNDGGSHQALTINPGVTIETGNSYVIVLSFPFDVYGKREGKNVAFNFALTLIFD
ncbi:MAG: hypothetical protein KAG64_08130 [Bacteroidales bacterium]|nr:hypothetical protein [Bacteroidales bacterium]